MKKELREAFRIYDKEGNGYIPTSALKEILHELDAKGPISYDVCKAFIFFDLFPLSLSQSHSLYVLLSAFGVPLSPIHYGCHI